MTDLFKKSIGIAKQDDTSGKYKLDEIDYRKLLIHLGVVGASAILVVVGEYALKLDMGSMNVILIPLISTGITAVQKWLKDNDEQV